MSGPAKTTPRGRANTDGQIALSPRMIEAIASRTADLVIERMTALTLRPSGEHDFATFSATAADIAARYAITADWVRAHAEALGGVRIGSGPKARHRFNPETVEGKPRLAEPTAGRRSC